MVLFDWGFCSVQFFLPHLDIDLVIDRAELVNQSTLDYELKWSNREETKWKEI